MSITGDDYGPLLRTLDWTLFGASSIIVSLRMITRVWIIRKPGWDDATMALSQVRLLRPNMSKAVRLTWIADTRGSTKRFHYRES